MRNLIILLGILTVSYCNAQSFPDKCLGIWQGTMKVYQNAQLIDTPEVTFKVAPVIKDSIWTWRTSYKSEKYGMISKDYKLVTKNRKTGTYLLDEGQDIYLDAQVINESMYSTFEVEKSALHSKYEFKGEQLYFEVITSLKDSDTTYVKSYPVVNVQYVTLTRKLE